MRVGGVRIPQYLPLRSSCAETPAPTPPPTPPPVDANAYCAINLCTQEVWDTVATDGGGSYNCGSRITWLQTQGYNEADACVFVASKFPGLCSRNPASFVAKTLIPTPSGWFRGMCDSPPGEID